MAGKICYECGATLDEDGHCPGCKRIDDAAAEHKRLVTEGMDQDEAAQLVDGMFGFATERKWRQHPTRWER